MTQLSYVIMFVADMDAAVSFYRDVVGLPLRFSSPEWTELETGATTLALHRATADSPAGKVDLGVTVPDITAFHQELTAKGVSFPQPPVQTEHGMLATFLTPDGASVSVSQG